MYMYITVYMHILYISFVSHQPIDSAEAPIFVAAPMQPGDSMAC